MTATEDINNQVTNIGYAVTKRSSFFIKICLRINQSLANIFISRREIIANPDELGNVFKKAGILTEAKRGMVLLLTLIFCPKAIMCLDKYRTNKYSPCRRMNPVQTGCPYDEDHEI